jgi:hypothetical protein
LGLVDNHCRIDNNQHAIVGLHHALEVARHRDGAREAPSVELPDPPTEGEIRATEARFARQLAAQASPQR